MASVWENRLEDFSLTLEPLRYLPPSGSLFLQARSQSQEKTLKCSFRSTEPPWINHCPWGCRRLIGQSLTHHCSICSWGTRRDLCINLFVTATSFHPSATGFPCWWWWRHTILAIHCTWTKHCVSTLHAWPHLDLTRILWGGCHLQVTKARLREMKRLTQSPTTSKESSSKISALILDLVTYCCIANYPKI